MLKLKFPLQSTLALSILFSPAIAHASLTSQDITDILVNLEKVLDPALVLLLAISFIVGIFFILKGLLELKAFAMPLTQASRPGELSGPILHIFVGTVLVYIPTTTNVLSSTFFGSVPSMFNPSGGGSVEQLGQASNSIMGYASVALESQWATLIDTVVYYMQFIGFIAFIRGWIIVAHSHHGGEQNSLTKGIIHIVGGILAINFLPLVQAVTNTIGGTS
jgi:intracellular multiplication protein IcmC